jgi:biotin operon repressor
MMYYEDESRKVSAQSRRAHVLEKLVRAEGAWVPGPDLAGPESGGSEGLRRVRELRTKGWKIETRRMKGRDAWEYRLIAPPPPTTATEPRQGVLY